MKKSERIAGNVANYVDERTGAAAWARKNLTKVFPDHWSFMLGEVALYSFIILLLTGTFLTFWFVPSQADVVYNGSYAPLSHVTMSAAYSSTLHISFDVRGGLLMRQIHHWAALLFMVAIVAHLLRVFFTGAFRKPREFNWLIGVGLLTLGIVEGFLGYSLPDDLLSGTGIRIAEAIIQAIPVVGSYLAFFAFGGPFPGHVFIPRIYTVHVLLLPGIFLALITAHLMLVWYQKHTQYPGPGRTEKNVVGYPLMPVYMAKAGGFFFIVFGVTAFLGAVASINPIWLYGPYTPGHIRWQSLVVVICLFVLAVYFLPSAGRFLDSDEEFYFYAAAAVSKGLGLYTDLVFFSYPPVLWQIGAVFFNLAFVIDARMGYRLHLLGLTFQFELILDWLF